jgi:hypothetical protein
MSTHAQIILHTNDNKFKFKSIYVHYDGYVKNGVGETLWFAYDTYQSVETLFKKSEGFDIRTLGDEVSFFDDVRGNSNILVDETEEAILDVYNYLFSDGKWYVFDGAGKIMGTLADCLK